MIYEVFQDVPSPDYCESEDSDESDHQDDCDWKELSAEIQNFDFLSGLFQVSALIDDKDVGQAIYPVQLDSILNEVNMDDTAKN